jgi:putative oxidoreductase
MKKLFSITHTTKNVDMALLITRIAIALMMLTHGIPKMAGFAETPVKFMDIFGMGAELSLALAVFAEVFCSFLLIFGLGTRLAVIPLIVTMLIAVLHVHAADPFAKQEMGWHFLLVYVVLFILGSGRYSLDSLLVKKNENKIRFNPAATAL